MPNLPFDLAVLKINGCTICPGLFDLDVCNLWIEQWNAFLISNPQATALRTAGGAIYGARNLIREWPELGELASSPPIANLVCEVLGPTAGLVRALFFDKPPEQSWALPWHRDLSIAVKDNGLGGRFHRPTLKHGVPHVEATAEVLDRMLTVRLHLDPATAENGPLQVVPGSHAGRTADPVLVLADAGDAFLMRPRLLHASGDSAAGTLMHRRLFHFEFAADPVLPDGYEWYDFVPVGKER